MPFEEIKIGTATTLKEGTDIAILSIGDIAKNVSAALNNIDNNERVAHFDMRFVKPLDRKLLHSICNKYTKIITVENGVKIGGFGSAVLEFMAENKYTNQIHIMGISDSFIEHGTIPELHKEAGIDPSAIEEKIKSLLL